MRRIVGIALLTMVALLPACGPRAGPWGATPAAPPVPVLVSFAAAEVAPSAVPDSLARHYGFILAAQTPEGAISFNLDHNYVNPYFGNLAARALLTDPAHLPAVQRHMDWYLAHLNEDGTIDDFTRRGGALRATGHHDSADSYAATFLTVVARYLEAGGDPDWVWRNRAELGRVESLLIGLTDRDGLTWAKPLHFLKFLMDNCEVYAGWSDWARALELAGDLQGAQAAGKRADAAAAGLERFRQSDGLWAWGLDRLGLQRRSQIRRFYPDAVAQLFPTAWGLANEPDLLLRFDEAHPLWRELSAGDFPWTFPAFAAARLGQDHLVAVAEAAAERQYPDLQPRWFVAESAWLILARAENRP